MPLPDERPRQSVANLIGRFEQQNKRQSLSGPPRTGDEAKEEPVAKEKKEWPPKPIIQDKPPAPIIPSSSWSRSLSPPSKQTSPPAETGSPPAAPDNDPIPAPAAVIISPASPIVADHPQKQSSIDDVFSRPESTAPYTSPPATSPVKIPASTRTSNVTRSKTPVKSAARSPVRSSLASSTSQPLRPQHTGNSTSTSRKPVTKTVPSTPSRAKTPSAERAKTPSRAKSPSTRPKTPSSGLFAPTAASLARARNAAPQLPTPTKKVSLGSSASDRLSKPTAASMNKVRSPAAGVSTASPARGVAKPAPARGGAAKGLVKSKTGSALKTKLQGEKATGGSSGTDGAHEDDVLSQSEDGHGIDPSQSTGVISNVGSEVHEDSVAEYADDIQEEPTVEEASSHDEDTHVHGMEADSYTSHQDLPVSPPETTATEPQAETVPHHSPSTLHTSDANISKSEEGRIDEVKPRSHSGTNIEDIVTFLESTPDIKLRPSSIASIPNVDDVVEIPDEE